MGRTKSVSAIESELSKAEASLKKAQKKVDDLSELVLKLQRQKQEYEAKRIMDAYRKSGRTLEEFHELLDMPEAFIIRRWDAEICGLKAEWLRARKAMSDKERVVAEEIVSSGLYETLQFPFSYLSGERENPGDPCDRRRRLLERHPAAAGRKRTRAQSAADLHVWYSASRCIKRVLILLLPRKLCRRRFFYEKYY